MKSLTLHKRRLQGHKAKDQTFTQMDLSDTSAYGSTWNTCEFIKCDLSLADFSNGAVFEGSNFYDCDLRMTTFRASILRDCTFIRCNMRKVAFVGCSPIQGCMFEDCLLQYSGFYDASVYDTTFRDCNLHGADLRFIEALGNDFCGSVLWGAAVNIGCQFFNSKFDERSVAIWTAIASRAHPNPESATILRDLSGKHYATAERLMSAPQDRVSEGGS